MATALAVFAWGGVVSAAPSGQADPKWASALCVRPFQVTTEDRMRMYIGVIEKGLASGHLQVADVEAAIETLRNTNSIPNPYAGLSIKTEALGLKDGLAKVAAALKMKISKAMTETLSQELLKILQKHGAITTVKSAVREATKEIMSPRIVPLNKLDPRFAPKAETRRDGSTSLIYVSEEQPNVLHIAELNPGHPHITIRLGEADKIFSFSSLLITPDGRELIVVHTENRPFSQNAYWVDLSAPHEPKQISGMNLSYSTVFLSAFGRAYAMLKNPQMDALHIKDLDTDQEIPISQAPVQISVMDSVAISSGENDYVVTPSAQGIVIGKVKQAGRPLESAILLHYPQNEQALRIGRPQTYQARSGKKYLIFQIIIKVAPNTFKVKILSLDLSPPDQFAIREITTLDGLSQSEPSQIMNAGDEDWLVFLDPPKGVGRILRLPFDFENLTPQKPRGFEHSTLRHYFFRAHDGHNYTVYNQDKDTKIIESVGPEPRRRIEWLHRASLQNLIQVFTSLRPDGRPTTYAIFISDNGYKVVDLFAVPKTTEVAP